MKFLNQRLLCQSTPFGHSLQTFSQYCLSIPKKVERGCSCYFRTACAWSGRVILSAELWRLRKFYLCKQCERTVVFCGTAGAEWASQDQGIPGKHFFSHNKKYLAIPGNSTIAVLMIRNEKYHFKNSFKTTSWWIFIHVLKSLWIHIL